MKMTEVKFIEQAKKFGYSDDEIQDLLDLQKESGIPFDKIILIDHTIN